MRLKGNLLSPNCEIPLYGPFFDAENAADYTDGMSKVICGVSASIDNFMAGPNQSLDQPLGDIPHTLLHRWMFEEPEKHPDELASLCGIAGAYIMGRNMFGPRGSEYDQTWQGWWGENPPYHAPVFVLTHRARESFTMEGGTSFTFVTDGITSALQQAQAAAQGKDVAIAGGASVVNQFLAAGLIDELWLHVAPVTVGQGARLFEDVPNLQLEPLTVSGTKLVTHIKYRIQH